MHTPAFRRLTLLPLLLLLVVAFGSRPIAAQTPAASVTGAVLDPDQRPVPNAAIVVRSDTGATAAAVVTDRDGHFEVVGLVPGTYIVDVTVTGFAPESRSGVRVVAGKPADVSFVL